MAYAYEATGLNLPQDNPSSAPVNSSLYMIQNLSTLQHPDSEYAIPPVGFSFPSGVFYDIASPQDGTGRNFYVDPTGGTYDLVTNPGGGIQVRRVALTFGESAPAFAIGTGKSYGRFTVAVDRYVMHSQGYVFGISFDTHKLYILQLATMEMTDATAPFATLASGFGTRDGLMAGPQAIASGLDGRVLVLEAVNNRIQAFDTTGKPVAYFGAAGSKTSIMPLTGTGSPKYLDLAVESKGYIFVLKYTDGSDPTTFAVDLYEPDGTFLVTTSGVAAANIAVDILRNLFALNYEVILGTSGRTEPSVSLWIPPAPPK
jgi:hypothetical protein